MKEIAENHSVEYKFDKHARITWENCQENRKYPSQSARKYVPAYRRAESKHVKRKRVTHGSKQKTHIVDTNIDSSNYKEMSKKKTFNVRAVSYEPCCKKLDNKEEKLFKMLLKVAKLLANDPTYTTEIFANQILKFEEEFDKFNAHKMRMRCDTLSPIHDDKHASSSPESNVYTLIKARKEKQLMPNSEHIEKGQHIDRNHCPKILLCENASTDPQTESNNSTRLRTRCTPVNDTVDLKSQYHLKKYPNNVSKDDKKSDTKKDVLKEVINGHLEETTVEVNITAAPVYTKGSKSGKKCKKRNHENGKDEDLIDEVTIPVKNDACKEELLGACSTDVKEGQLCKEELLGACSTDIKDGQLDLCRSEDSSTSKRANHDNVNQSQIVTDGGLSTEFPKNHVDSVLSSLSLCTNNTSTPGIFKCPLISTSSSVPSIPGSYKTENIDIVTYSNTEQTSSQVSQNSIQPTNLPKPEVDQDEIQKFEPLMEIIDKIADGERVPPQITMQYEMLRFCTLRSFPKHNKPYITRIAAAGFYFANTDDEVVCYSCARRKRNWCEDDNPMEIHRELNPNCSFLLRNSEVNVPVRMSEIHQDSTRASHSRSHQNTIHADPTSGCSTISQITSTLTSHSKLTTTNSSQNITQTISSTGNFSSSTVDSTNNTSLQNRMHQRAHGNFVQTMSPSSSSMAQELQSNHTTVSSNFHDTPIVSSSAAMPISQLSAGGTSTNTAPKYPKYVTKTVRLTSFNDCGDIVIPPESLATSGFFYAGFGDCVRCFQCGVGLRHWSDEDDPWIEHCRWSKDCLFVKQVKGQEFVNLVQMAVQYSQNQNRNGQTSSRNTTGMNAQSSEDAVIEQQMHTNASQSVLEMGYDPDVIRNALRALRNANDGQTISAATLMEKIFELEDEASNTLENDQLVQGTPPSQQNTRSAQDTDRNNTLGISRDISSASSNYVSTQAVAIDNASSSATSSGSVTPGTSRAQSKKSQLLEQKKLKQENEQLKQQSMCTKCKTNDVCIVFLPCGHLVTCETCAPTVRYCSVQDCGKYIKGTVRTYLA